MEEARALTPIVAGLLCVVAVWLLGQVGLDPALVVAGVMAAGWVHHALKFDEAEREIRGLGRRIRELDDQMMEIYVLRSQVEGLRSKLAYAVGEWQQEQSPAPTKEEVLAEMETFLSRADQTQKP